MKKKLIYALLLAVGVSIVEPSFSVFALETKKEFNMRNIGIENSDTLIDMINTKDGGYLIITSNGVFRKYDSKHQLEWIKDLKGNYLQKVVETNNGYIVVGYFYGSARDGLILQLDTNGEITNRIELVGTNTEMITAVTATSDGGFIIGGNTSSTNIKDVPCLDGQYYSFVKKYDANNIEQWTYADRGINATDSGQTITDIIETSDKGFVATGQKGSTSYKVFKLNQVGQKQWYKSSGGGRKHYAKKVFELENNQYMLVGNENLTNSSGYSKPFVQIYDNTGTVITTKNYLALNNGIDFINSATKDPDGGYTLIGYSKSTNANWVNNGDRDGFIMKLNSNFELVNSINWGGTGKDYFTKGIYVNNELFLGGITASAELVTIGKEDIVLGSYGLKKSPSISPTVNKTQDGKIEIIDNNPELEQYAIYYRTKNSVTNEFSNWILYTTPFSPVYDGNGQFNLEVKSINTFELESETVMFNEVNNDYVETEASKSIDVLFSQVDTLELELSTNTIDFGNVDGLIDTEMTEALTTTVNSSLPWNMSIKALTDFVSQEDETNTLPSTNLQVKISGTTEYKDVAKEDVALLENQAPGTNIENKIDFNLKANTGINASNYKITTKLKVSQQ